MHQISGEKECVYVCERERVFKLGYCDEKMREREREKEIEREGGLFADLPTRLKFTQCSVRRDKTQNSMRNLLK